MHLSFSLFEVLLVIGITHGFVIASLIWLNKKRSVSKFLLSLVLTVFNLLCIKILIVSTEIWQIPVFRYLPLAFELAIQPLIWLFISSLTKSDFYLQRKYLWHFLPFAISFIYSLYIYIAVLSQKELAAKDVIANNFYFNNIKEAEDYLSIFSSILYWLLGLRLIIRYREWLYNNISNTNYQTYAWLKNVCLLMGILIAGLTIDIFLDYFFHFGSHHFLHWQLFFIYLAVLIYFIGFRGYQLTDKQNIIAKNGYQQEILNLAYQEQKELINNSDSSGKFEKKSIINDKENKLSHEKREQIKAEIIKVFEMKELYLDPELNLQKLAKEISCSPAIVSAVINSQFGKNFRNLVNEYRVKKVKQMFEDSEYNKFSILGVAYKCGFNSEASFYRIFKETVGISPKEYIKRLQSSK